MPTSHDSTALLIELDKQLQAQLSPRLEALFLELDNTLFDSAEKSRSTLQQQRYFDALRQLRLHREEIGKQFLSKAKSALRLTNAKESVELSPSPLRLVDKDEQEEKLSLEHRNQRSFQDLSVKLTTLLQRLGEINSARFTEAAEDFGLSPNGLTLSFRQALSCVELHSEIRLLALQRFGHHVLSALDQLYTSANQHLIDAGVLPELVETNIAAKLQKKSASSSAETPVIPSASKPSENSSHHVAMPDGHHRLLAEIQHLISTQKPSAFQANITSSNTPHQHDHTPAQHLPSSDLDAAISALWTYEGDPLAFKSQLLASARELSTKQNAELGTDQENIIDLIGLIFSKIQQDPNLPAPLQSMLSRLHIPFLRTALKDPSLLFGEAHPARELVDELGQLAVGWCPSVDPNNALLKQVALTVEQLASHFKEEMPIDFDSSIKSLRSQLEAHRRRTELTEQRTIEAAKGRERLHLARTRITAQLEQLLAEQPPTPWTRQLLRGPWSNHLVLVWLRHGEDSEAFRNATLFIHNLLWCDEPLAARSDPERMASLRTQLPIQLRQGLQGVIFHDSEADVLVKHLEEFLEAQLNNDTLPAYLFETDPSLQKADFSSHTKAAELEDQPQHPALDQALLEKLRRVPAGTWFEFKANKQADIERAKLSWSSPDTGNTLFVNRNGMRVRETSQEALAVELESGLARIIESNRLLERTLQDLINELRQSNSADHVARA